MYDRINPHYLFEKLIGGSSSGQKFVRSYAVGQNILKIYSYRKASLLTLKEKNSKHIFFLNHKNKHVICDHLIAITISFI